MEVRLPYVVITSPFETGTNIPARPIAALLFSLLAPAQEIRIASLPFTFTPDGESPEEVAEE